MSEEELLNLQCLVGNYLNGFKIVSVEKDPFIQGQINLFTDSTEDIGFGDRSVIKFWIKNEESNVAICREQLNKNTYILTEFEKWLEETINYLERSKESRNEYKLQILIYKHCLINLQELKEGKK